MGNSDATDVVEMYADFLDEYYGNEITDLAENHTNNQRSLYIDYSDLDDFHSEFAEDHLSYPTALIGYAEEALQEHEPEDTDFSEVNVRIENVPNTVETVREHNDYISNLVSVRGIVSKATEPSLRITEATLVCQLCGTHNHISQEDNTLQEPRECIGCERSPSFKINEEESEFIDSQRFTIYSVDANTADGDDPFSVEVIAEGDIVGVSAGDYLTINGILRVRQEGETTSFEPYLKAVSINPFNQSSPSVTSGRKESMSIERYVEVASNTLASHPDTTREPGTKAKFITPFVEALGWNKFDNNECLFEYTDSKTERRVDYALFGDGSETPDVVIEAKHVGKVLSDYEEQIYDYLRIFSADYGILTNGESFYIYRNERNKEAEKLTETKLRDLANAAVLDHLKPQNFDGD